MGWSSVFAAVAVAAQTAIAFEFAGLNTTSELTFASAGLDQCFGTVVQGFCRLASKSFASIPITYSTVVIRNKHLVPIRFSSSVLDYNLAIDAFKAKYGPFAHFDAQRAIEGGQVLPQSFTWYFSDGVLITTHLEGTASFSVVFAANKKTAPVIDF